MGNRQSSTEEVDETPVIHKDEAKDGCDDDDSYCVKQHFEKPLDKKNLKLILPDDNTDESNNTHSESTNSNQSFNQSFGSSTTRTKYGETNSVVTSDYDSECSWSDVGETSKSNTVSKESLYDTDDLTALTDLAHYGDDEGTKNISQQSKKKRRSKWLKMINAQEQVVVHNNPDDDEVETVLETDDNLSLQSLLKSMQSNARTEGDEETTILIIDADEEYSRCSFNAMSYQKGNDFELSANNHRVVEGVVLENTTVVMGEALEHNDVGSPHSEKLTIVLSSEIMVELPNVRQPHQLGDENDRVGMIKDQENELVHGERVPILLVDGILGDPVEANKSRRPMISSHAEAPNSNNFPTESRQATIAPQTDVPKSSIILKESSSSIHNNSEVTTLYSFSNLKSIPSKKSDPSGSVVRGTDIPEKNKRKVPRKLLDDVELNPRRVEMQRQALRGAHTVATNTERRNIFLGSNAISEKIAGQSLPVTNVSNGKGAPEKVKPVTSDLKKETKHDQPVENDIPLTSNQPPTEKNCMTHERDCKEETRNDGNSNDVLDTSMTQSETKAKVKGSSVDIPNNLQNLKLEEATDNNKAIQLPSGAYPQRLVAESTDIQVPTNSIDINMLVHQPVNDTVKVVSTHKDSSSIKNAAIVNSSSWYSQNATTGKPIPESSQRIKRFEKRHLTTQPIEETSADKIVTEGKQTMKDRLVNEDEKHSKCTVERIDTSGQGMDTKQITSDATNLPTEEETFANKIKVKEPTPKTKKSDSKLQLVKVKSIATNTTQNEKKEALSASNSEPIKGVRVPSDNHQFTTTVDQTSKRTVNEKRNLPSVVEKKIIGRGSYQRQSSTKVKIRPEQCYIEMTTSTHDTGAKASTTEIEPRKTIKATSPKPENGDERIRKSSSRQSANITSVVEILDDDDDIDFVVVKQYDDTFNELLRRYPQFITENPSLMEIIKVAKLQKILSATLEMERELEDYVQSLRDQKNEVSAHYQNKLIEASRKNAEREYFLQAELDTLKSEVIAQDHSNQWDLLSMYKDFCTQYQKNQIAIRSPTRNSDDPLSLLRPETLSAEKTLLLEALTCSNDINGVGDATIRGIQRENLALNQDILEIENELNRFKQSSEANGNSWVDSVLCNMDANQFAYLKQLHDSKHKTK